MDMGVSTQLREMQRSDRVHERPFLGPGPDLQLRARFLLASIRRVSGGHDMYAVRYHKHATRGIEL
jgi:hypothetical protein